MDFLQAYDSNMIPIFSYEDGQNISFALDFSGSQKRYVNIIYSGSASNISLDNIQNITERVVFENKFVVLAKQKCDNMKSLSYDYVRELLGQGHNFRIDGGCDFGPQPPSDASVIVRRMPILIEGNSTLESGFVTLKVW